MDRFEDGTYNYGARYLGPEDKYTLLAQVCLLCCFACSVPNLQPAPLRVRRLAPACLQLAALLARAARALRRWHGCWADPPAACGGIVGGRGPCIAAMRA